MSSSRMNFLAYHDSIMREPDSPLLQYVPFAHNWNTSNEMPIFFLFRKDLKKNMKYHET